MKPVFQTIVDKRRGDCMRATVASLLELEIEQVPHFILFDKYFDIFWAFIRSLGYDYNGCGYLNSESSVVPKMPKLEDSIDGYFYAVVPSKTFSDITHAVVMDMTGMVVHDPNPNGLWQGINIIESKDLKYWYLLEKTEA